MYTSSVRWDIGATNMVYYVTLQQTDNSSFKEIFILRNILKTHYYAIVNDPSFNKIYI